MRPHPNPPPFLPSVTCLGDGWLPTAVYPASQQVRNLNEPAISSAATPQHTHMHTHFPRDNWETAEWDIT